ncbi:hypothetical protein SprV_0401453600 [Sparganum proliferum]
MNRGGGGDDGGIGVIVVGGVGRVNVFNGTSSGEGDDGGDEVDVVNSSGDEGDWVDNGNGLNPLNTSRIGDCGPKSCGEEVSANKASGSGVSGVEGFGDDGDGDGHAISAVGSETIPASSPVAVVTSSTAAAKTTITAAVGTNAIKEVATLTFSTTSSDHGADFAITNPTTNVPLSAGLGGVQTIDATTTALPTAATLGHPDTPNATQSAAAKVVVRTGTPTTTSTTTATRMVDIEAGGSSSNCRRVHTSVSDAVPRPLPHSVSAPNRIDCVAIAVAVVAETLNPTDITAGTLVSADPFPTTFPSTVSNPRGVEGVESIANINPILLITRPVGNVYLVSTIVTLPAAGAVHATDTADDDADAAVIAATTPIHFAYLAWRCSRLP